MHIVLRDKEKCVTEKSSLQEAWSRKKWQTDYTPKVTIQLGIGNSRPLVQTKIFQQKWLIETF
jgi:hypothetical protein